MDSNRKNILLIEDDPFLREIIAEKLKREGYMVKEAVTGERGLEEAKQEKPSLVVLDLILPGIDGFEVLRKMKQDTETSEIPVLILSNFGQKEDIKRGLDLGALDYLIKAHLTPSEVVKKVNEVFGIS